MSIHKRWFAALLTCVLLASPLVLAQALDPLGAADLKALQADQLEKFNTATVPLSGAGARNRQVNPVSAPVKASVSAPIVGFSAGGLRPFGEQFLSGGVIPFAAAGDMPVPNDYVVGIGDTIELRLFGKENRTYLLPVERTGTVTLQGIGPVPVAGMTYEMVAKTLLDQISTHKIGVEATVNMGSLRSIQIFLMGEVNNPAAYATDALTTVVNALLVGGGIKPSGSMRKIEVRRNGAVVTRIDLYEALLQGGTKNTIRLRSGDTIFVPTVGRRVGIGGDVLRPAIYELAGEKTAEDLIALAGGLSPTAFPARSKLDRIGQDGKRQVHDMALATPTQRKLELLDGDILTVPSVVARWDKSVTLAGSVERAGDYEWTQGMKLSALIPSFEVLERDAYRPLAIIERIDPASGAKRLLSVNLLDIVRGKTAEVLEPGDRVTVLSLADVDFLSSANVQFVLVGRLPPEEGDANNPVVLEDREANKVLEGQANARRLVQGDLLNTANRFSDPAKLQDANAGVDAARSINGPKTAQVRCGGLVEVSDIIRREGTERFRAAILSSGQDAQAKRLVRSASCPAVFQTPGLLTFVLENVITVRGEVKQPGVLPIPEGLALDVALSARGGLTREADPSGVEVSRQVAVAAGSASFNRTMVKLGALAQTALEPGNLVLVRKRFSEMDTGIVRLSGEFTHPGSFEIRRGERLSEVIARAGGITSQAYPQGAVFLRQSVKEEKRQYYQKAAYDLQNSILMGMTRMRTASTTATADAGAGTVMMSLVNQMRTMEPVGRMVVEADPTVLQVRKELDVLLEPGDEIHVPRRPSSILVMGEVLNPGSVQFVSGKKAADYIASVGGLSQLADENRIFAILPNGNAEPLKISSWNFRPTLLPPGSTIYVSREALPTTATDLMLLSLQVAKDLALSAAALSVISK
ncbi:protein involved in polysaccharide export, contains SLBB domain of the beta-grasp fold [Propionivibrio dicarboxylicus]|uniref:Protein involved in polysaccharide export, contains SLBB domain of the beta-grasp fold n=1 Tax=Propionivibrio dicarboxylicus TaxID=83767 RepID=A0A1G8ECF4_9RHOO|nr:protein involved in polysaccharide export, contains SLBB domain of the beta-grasp fold [Propionivibrio dicarboxylicus]SDI82455.1 protein involved in polysaccharide export, contains SLBB domain of the beta-grasp fold [Propionivibrio dicarboxylicus]